MPAPIRPNKVAQLAASIRHWGWTTPVLVDEGGALIAGHGRVLAAAELGLTSVPTMVVKAGEPVPEFFLSQQQNGA
jgi:ParB-like chromosome segregation protein Spo0J